AAAMDHHDRVAMGLRLRNLVLDESLSHHRHVAVARDVFAADVEIALFGDRQGLVGRASGARHGADEEQATEPRNRKRAWCNVFHGVTPGVWRFTLLFSCSGSLAGAESVGLPPKRRKDATSRLLR